MQNLKRYQRSLFIFRRDLRCEDNTALIRALTDSTAVIACFILDPRQIDPHPYHSQPAMVFMKESLDDLEKQLAERGAKLFVFQGKAENVVGEIIIKEKVQAVYINEDYTPFSVTRDLGIKNVCERHGAGFHSFADALLNPPKEIVKNTGGVYTVFTPFYNKASQIKINRPATNNSSDFFSGAISVPTVRLPVVRRAGEARIKGGRAEALKILEAMKTFKNYDVDRDLPAKSATSHLSAHHKLGTCSIRETYYAACDVLGPRHTFVKELYWRDFFTHIAYHFPHVFGGAFYPEYDALLWSVDKERFQRWCEGSTGFPIVDAGMRELNATGFMHNRVRMITASFLVKDLHIDWRWGERYFAQHLVDYDPCVNNGNWQWVASTGCDHQPYFRVFNPWLQQKKFDPLCLYIKKWVPELKTLDPQQIHRWYEVSGDPAKRYPVSIVDHSAESEKAKEMFKRLKKVI